MTIGVYCVNRETGVRYVRVVTHEVVPLKSPELHPAFERCGCPQAPHCWARTTEIDLHHAKGSECNGG